MSERTEAEMLTDVVTMEYIDAATVEGKLTEAVEILDSVVLGALEDRKEAREAVVSLIEELDFARVKMANANWRKS